MASGFAGAQRAGERLRRRLATGTDEAEPDTPTPRPLLRRRDAEAEAHERPMCAAAADLSLARIVPDATWKHVLLAALGFLVSAAVIAAGVRLPQVIDWIGPGATALFAPGSGSVLHWLLSAELVLVSQMALVVWWIRSHSLKDFGGRYHLWTRVAIAAAIWSFGLSTGVHTLAGTALAARLGWRFEDAGTILWMGPTLLVGVGLVWGLHLEMALCRGSLAFVQAASLAGFAYTLLGLRLIPLPADWKTWEASLLDGVTLVMVWLLAVGTLLHTRFVVHQNAEPSATPRWRLRIPRPHFRLFGRRRRDVASPEEAATSEQNTRSSPEQTAERPAKPNSRTRAAKSKVEEPTREAEKPVEPESPRPASPSRPLEAASPPAVSTKAVEPAMDVPPPVVLPKPAAAAAPAPPVVEERVFVTRTSPPTPPVPASRYEAESTDDTEDADTSGQESDDGDEDRYQGMSKKQRRKLEAKERAQQQRRR